MKKLTAILFLISINAMAKPTLEEAIEKVQNKYAQSAKSTELRAKQKKEREELKEKQKQEREALKGAR